MPIRDNVIDFRADLDKASKALHLTLQEMTRSIVLQLLRMIVIATPVDTGRAAGSWSVRGGSTDSYVLPVGAGMTKDEAIEAAMAKINAINFDNLDQVYWIYNNLPYIEALEYGLYPDPPKKGSYVKGQGWIIKTVGGYSKQAPAGMVRISIAGLEAQIDFIIRKAEAAS